MKGVQILSKHLNSIFVSQNLALFEKGNTNYKNNDFNIIILGGGT